MEINVTLQNGQLPKKYGKFAAAVDIAQQHYPLRSFPIIINNINPLAQSLALTLVDPDSIPVCGFEWIHWTAANIPTDIQQIPEDASQHPTFNFLQGKNSTAGSLIGQTNPKINQHFNGPTPPQGLHLYELRIFALDKKLNLTDGFWLNELKHAMNGHIIEHQKLILPYRG
ncbi:YbhB/YbcL family Raf kinase inhibitor-like protein [Bombilactobacillus thymidiniphilus]|uniref:YbhB/YbcL family Raf kinase inhibitor-like protein n=1 Tax=Bombilactobacillus thymidiniphilus TaxID=2923363 RepID=A0ABY4PEJ7_9LACO|nr:YbhB/YbcL family Raf kinase inhibitor-like protein [Bombilactobacillus thymidiniphilus]UQS84055.1 YbhB/YbcL family Raf kinase inhibitor-like protein [Bombilactobacillus thymidiniphilus]